MPQLDSYTLNFANFLLSTVMALTMYSMYMASKKEKALLEWANAGLFNVLGYGLDIFDKDYIFSLSIHISVANLFYLMAHIAILRGILRFLNFQLYTKTSCFLMFTLFNVQLIPNIATNLEYRIYLFSFAILIIKFITIRILYKAMISEKGWFYIPLLLTELFFLAQMLTRTFLVLFKGTSFDFSDANTSIQTVGWLSDVLFLSVATVSCLLLVFRKQVNEIERLSYRDQLTGCFNRHALNEKTNILFNNNLSSKSLGVALLDIDFFKRINDEFGHDAGDSALKHVSSIIDHVIEEKGWLYRIGGEEFLILLPNCSESSLLELAESVRKKIESSPLIYNNHTFTITSSFGITISHPNESWPDVLKRTDIALYQAKEGGRNKCVSIEPQSL